MKVKIIPSDGNNAQTSSLGTTAQKNVQSQLGRSKNLRLGIFSMKKTLLFRVWHYLASNLALDTICVCSWTCEVWKRKKFCFIYTQKTHSFWNAKRIYSEWRRLLLTSCICTVQPVWEMRIVHLNWTQICKCTSTGLISMKKSFWEKYCIKKSTSTLSPCISCVKWWLYFQMHKLLSSLYRKIPRRENQTF